MSRQTVSRPFIATVVIIPTIIVLSHIFGGTNKPPPTPVATAPKASTAQPPHAENVFAYYTQKHDRPDVYWMHSATKDPAEWIRSVSWWTEQTEEAYRNLKDMNPLTRKIYGAYQHFGITEFYDGMSMFVEPTAKGIEARMEAIKHGGIEICLVPENQFQKYRNQLPSKLYYRMDWNAIMVVAIEVPLPFRVALMYHELGHAYKRVVEHAPSAHAPANSDSFIEEELQMHELEYQILVKMSQGKLEELFEEIVRRGTEVPMDAITKNDLDRFDQMFGLEKTGRDMAGIYYGTFLMSLGFHAASPDPAERRLQLIQYYRSLTRQ